MKYSTICWLCCLVIVTAGQGCSADPKTADIETPTSSKSQTIQLFNGKDLTGWKVHGKSRWEVKDGILLGRQGPNNEPGDLLTVDSYDDFEVSVTFKVVWPANTGIWYRYQSTKQAFQADILEHKEPYALTGSLYCMGKKFLAINTDPAIVNRTEWNTMTVRAVGDRHVVILNDREMVDLNDDSSMQGRIGFQVHAGEQFEKMRVMVKSVTLRPIAGGAGSTDSQSLRVPE